MNQLEFISLESSDRLQLPGLLYSPDRQTKKAAIWLHGMGDSGVFYNPELVNALGEALAANDIALLAFNNRGAHGCKRLKILDEALPEENRIYQGGTYFEKITDCIQDVDGAAAWLKTRGFSELYLLGHSTGANKICAFHIRAKHNPFSKYVLAGPGDDVGLYFQSLGPKRFWKALKYAATMVDKDPLHTMPRYTGMYPFSAQSAWDIMNPDGAYNTFPYYECLDERLGRKPLFEEYRKIDKKTLVIIGKSDEYAHTAGDADNALKLFVKYTSNSQLKHADFISLPEADHSFRGREVEFAKTVSDWLAYD